MRGEADPNTLGGRIRILRRARGLSAAELAAKIGQSEGAVRNVENGTNGATLKRAKLYAEALGVTPEQLLFGTPSVAPSVDDTAEARFQPASRPGGSEETGRHQTAHISMPRGIDTVDTPSSVTLNINATVSIGTARKILAMIEEDQG